MFVEHSCMSILNNKKHRSYKMIHADKVDKFMMLVTYYWW